MMYALIRKLKLCKVRVRKIFHDKVGNSFFQIEVQCVVLDNGVMAKLLYIDEVFFKL